MTSSSSFLPSPLIFEDENYDLWDAKLRTYLTAQTMWELVENGSNPAPLLENLTVAQIIY